MNKILHGMDSADKNWLSTHESFAQWLKNELDERDWYRLGFWLLVVIFLVEYPWR